MPESKPSDRPRDYSAAWFAAGLVAMAAGASLFHPGAGLLLVGLALAGVGVFGAPRRSP